MVTSLWLLVWRAFVSSESNKESLLLCRFLVSVFESRFGFLCDIPLSSSFDCLRFPLFKLTFSFSSSLALLVLLLNYIKIVKIVMVVKKSF